MFSNIILRCKNKKTTLKLNRLFINLQKLKLYYFTKLKFIALICSFFMK